MADIEYTLVAEKDLNTMAAEDVYMVRALDEEGNPGKVSMSYFEEMEANCATSESNAATSEENAATSESNAATSADNAADSETNAQAYMENASASATAAATSETNAATSENKALAYYSRIIELFAQAASTAITGIAEEYQTDKSYVAGDACVYESLMYQCITATTGDWDESCWEAMPVAEYAQTAGLTDAQLTAIETALGGTWTTNRLKNILETLVDELSTAAKVNSYNSSTATLYLGSM